MKGQIYCSRPGRSLAVRLDLRPERAVLDVRGPGRLRRRRQGLGRVDCRVFADGKETLLQPRLESVGPAVPLKLPVAGADQLRLLVDFGRGQDTGDRVIWANARLYRPSPKTAAQSEPANRAPLDPSRSASRAMNRE